MRKDDLTVSILASTTGMFFVLWFVEVGSTEPVSTTKSFLAGLGGLIAGALLSKSGFFDDNSPNY